MRVAAAIVWVCIACACSSYTYYARTVGADSEGVQRELLAYWRVTERALWYDESSEGVVLKVACSTSTMDFEEQPSGIFLRADGSWEGVRDAGGQPTCGRVLDVEHVKDVQVGESITLDLWCTPARDEFTLAGAFLPAGKYVFTRVERQKQDVDVAACTQPVAAQSAPTAARK